MIWQADTLTEHFPRQDASGFDGEERKLLADPQVWLTQLVNFYGVRPESKVRSACSGCFSLILL
jgi:hypothetical protein